MWGHQNKSKILSQLPDFGTIYFSCYIFFNIFCALRVVTSSIAVYAVGVQAYINVKKCTPVCQIKRINLTLQSVMESSEISPADGISLLKMITQGSLDVSDL